MNRGVVTRTIITTLNWLVDLYSITQDTGKQIAWHLLTDEYKRSAFTVTANGAAAANATSVTVDALESNLKKGTLLDFGVKKFAKLTADALAGATTIAVEALATALVDNDTAVAISEISSDGSTLGQNFNAYFVPNGTVMVELPAEDYKIVPLSLFPAETGQCMVMMSDAKSDSKTDSLTGYGVTYSAVAYENLMPDAIANTAAPGTLPAGHKTKLGNRFIWRRAVDSRGA